MWWSRPPRRPDLRPVRSCAGPPRAAADDLHLDGCGLTPELAELIKRTFRGVHLLTYLKREALDESGKGTLFDKSAEGADIDQIKTLGTDLQDETP